MSGISVTDAKTSTIYALVDPRTEEIRYIGKTSRSLKARLRGHLAKGATKGHDKIAWITELRACGLKPSIVALRAVPEAEAATEEFAAVMAFTALGADLVNSLHVFGNGPGNFIREALNDYPAGLSDLGIYRWRLAEMRFNSMYSESVARLIEARLYDTLKRHRRQTWQPHSVNP